MKRTRTLAATIALSLAAMFLSLTRDTIGQRATERVMEELAPDILDDLSKTAFTTDRNGTQTVADKKHFGDLTNEEVRKNAITWLAERTNEFVNVLRPAIRSAVLDIQESDD